MPYLHWPVACNATKVVTRSSDKAQQALIGRRDALLRRVGNGGNDARGRPGAEPEVARSRAIAADPAPSERGELDEIEAALRRIHDGHWGLCVGCGHAIGRQRLLAVPEARLCLACQAEEEALG